MDYGHGSPLTNERLLLEYGFVLPGLEADTLELPFGAISIGIQAALEAGGAEEAEELEEEEVEELSLRQQELLSTLGDIESVGLRFNSDGRPTDATRALTLIVTAASPADVEYESTEKLLEATELAAATPPAARARCALHAIATEALAQVRTALAEGEAEAAEGFDAVAREYCLTRCAILERACDLLA